MTETAQVTQHQDINGTARKVALIGTKSSYRKQVIYWLDRCADEYELDLYTYDQILAQVGHESKLQYDIKENLWYRKSRLAQIFGRHHPDVKRRPNMYAGKPKALANYVYANRMGNGPPNSGDGYKYRGRGIIQVTGKAMYARLTREYNAMYPGSNVDWVKNPDNILKPKHSVRVVFLFMTVKNVYNKIVDAYEEGDSDYEITTMVTRAVNGGRNGLSARYKLFNRLHDISIEITD